MLILFHSGQRILIPLILMAMEIEVHEPLHSHNTRHMSEQYLGIQQKMVYSNKNRQLNEMN